MRLIEAGLGVAAVPLLSGCMMMAGWGHTAALDTHATGHMVSAQRVVWSQRAEASSDGLTVTLFVPVSESAVVIISAGLRSEHDDQGRPTVRSGCVSARPTGPSIGSACRSHGLRATGCTALGTPSWRPAPTW